MSKEILLVMDPLCVALFMIDVKLQYLPLFPEVP